MDLTSFEAINEHAGEDLTLEFGKPDPDGSVIAVLHNHTTGEVREQRLFMPFGRDWRQKAQYRMEEWNSDDIVPMTIVANSEEDG